MKSGDAFVDRIQDDAPALRRLGILLERAEQDEAAGTIHDRFSAISAIVDRMRKAVAAGMTPAINDAVHLRRLVTRLPKNTSRPRSASEIARWCAISELREFFAR